MSIRAIATLSLLAVAVPASSAAQSRTAADYMAAIEGAQASAGPNGLGAMILHHIQPRYHKCHGLQILLGLAQRYHLWGHCHQDMQ